MAKKKNRLTLSVVELDGSLLLLDPITFTNFDRVRPSKSAFHFPSVFEFDETDGAVTLAHMTNANRRALVRARDLGLLVEIGFGGVHWGEALVMDVQQRYRAQPPMIIFRLLPDDKFRRAMALSFTQRQTGVSLLHHFPLIPPATK